MKVHLVDGTYELFRFHYAPFNRDPRLGAQRGVLNTLLDMVASGATHIGIATDHVIESFRNDLLESYKDSTGVEPDLLAQFPEVEELLTLAGFTVWPQVRFEADDGLAAGAAMAAADPRVEQVLICTPDKDLAQCVSSDGRVVQVDRRRNKTYTREGVIEKFGVPPELIPDFLALVGDSADGIAGVAGWGAKSTAQVLVRYGNIENVPLDTSEWDIPMRGGTKLAKSLAANLEDVLLFRHIATVDPTAPVSATLDDLRWQGPQPGFDEKCASINAEVIAQKAHTLFSKPLHQN